MNSEQRELLIQTSGLELGLAYHADKLDEEMRNKFVEATNIGIEAYQKYYNPTQSLKANCQNLKVKEIKAMHPLEEARYRARGVYLPDDKCILYNQTQVEQLASYMGENQWPITTDQVRNHIVAHELFHHLETTQIGLVDNQLNVQKNLMLRDAAAQSFANQIFDDYPNELFDYVWLDQRNQERFLLLIKQIEGLNERE